MYQLIHSSLDNSSMSLTSGVHVTENWKCSLGDYKRNERKFEFSFTYQELKIIEVLKKKHDLELFSHAVCRTFYFISLVSLQQVSNTWKLQNKDNFIRVKVHIIYTIEKFGRICKEILEFAPMALRILYFPRFSFLRPGTPYI